MEDAKNTIGWVSLGLGISLWILNFASGCFSIIPIIGLVVLLIYPIEIIIGLAAVITGVLAVMQKNSAPDDQFGMIGGVLGALLGGGWLLLQLLVWGSVFLMGAVMFILTIIDNA